MYFAIEHFATSVMLACRAGFDNKTADHGSEQPPSGHTSSNASDDVSNADLSGCCSHFTGKPLYTCPCRFNCSINGTQTSLPLRLFMKVAAFPITINASRARDNSTLTRCGAAMKPMSPKELLRVKVAMTISLSSPW